MVCFGDAGMQPEELLETVNGSLRLSIFKELCGKWPVLDASRSRKGGNS